MIYLKSILAGVAALIAGVFVSAVAMIVSLMIESRDLPADQSYGWDPITFYRNSIVAWLFLAVAFLIGFAWEYRRIQRSH